MSRSWAKILCVGALAVGVAAASGAQEARKEPLRNAFRKTSENRQLKVRVLVLNYDPLVPSEGNRKLHEVFKWNNPREMAAQYQSQLEAASGGGLRFQVVEWRELNEIYPQKDGYRYGAEEYVRLRRAGKGWHEGGGQDYPRLLREQGVPALIDAGTVDEVWIFGDHYFGIWEASMAGPGAFFINGGVYPEVPTRRPFAFYGFNYERGVAEMLHNTSHRTEATLNRTFGEWNLKAPKNDWELFSANFSQSNGAAGVGTCHWPANAEKDYDYSNPRVVQSWAEEFLNYPKLTGAKKPVSRETWRVTGDLHLDYMRWYFTLLPRAPGANRDGRQNNWWKYVYDFDNYTPDGKPKPARAALVGEPVARHGREPARVRVAYSSPAQVDTSSLDGQDLRVLIGPGRKLPVSIVAVSDLVEGPYRVVTYQVQAPQGGWQTVNPGYPTLELPKGQVKDAGGRAFPQRRLGTLRIEAAAAIDR